MRGKGEGGISRVPKDPTLPLKYWQASIELPANDGKRRRKVYRSKDKKKALALLRTGLAELDRVGDLSTRDFTVADWMNTWYTEIALRNVRPKTAMAYKSLMNHWIIPQLGTIRLHKLTASDVRRLHGAMLDKKMSGHTVLQVHRILAVALSRAERDGIVGRNAAKLAGAPKRPKDSLRALTLDEGIKVLETAANDTLGSLWAAVLLTGQRQGELLGLERDRVTDVIDISWQLQRISWQHGCSPDCGRKRGWDCRDRKLVAPVDWEHRHLTGGLWLSRPKSKAGWREIPLVEPLKTILERYIAATADQPNPFNLVWHTEAGMPIDPKDESKAWHDLLKVAEVPRVRLHDGRHTTVDILYEAGVAEDLITEIVGHSVRAQTRAYKSRGNRKRLTAAMQSLSAMFTRPVDARSDTPAESGSSPRALEPRADSRVPTE